MSAPGLYIHIPFCASKCDYCAFVSAVRSESERTRYFRALFREMERRQDARMFDSVFLGGGTPSLMSTSETVALMKSLRQNYRIAEDAEITMEANPRTVTREKVSAYRAAGINRVSLGLQAAQDHLLTRVNRRQTFQDFERALALLGGFRVSVDLMLGLPDQTVSDVLETVRLLDFDRIGHVSAYGLKVEEGTKLFGYAPDDDLCADMYDAVVDALRKQGLYRYEISNFAKPTQECRHNLKYWMQCDYLGLGVAARGLDGDRRLANTDDFDAYCDGAPTFVEELLDKAAMKEEYIMLRLRLTDGIDLVDYRARFDSDFLIEYADALAFLTANRLLEITPSHCVIAPDKIYLTNQIIVRLIAA